MFSSMVLVKIIKNMADTARKEPNGNAVFKFALFNTIRAIPHSAADHMATIIEKNPRG